MHKGLLILLIVGLIFLIGFAVKEKNEQNNQIRNECEPTELIVIGNKGTRTRVYDCSGIELELRND